VTRIEYEAVTAAGRTVFTSPDEALARSWVAARKHEFPGLVVERVTSTVTRERAYTPRLTLVRVA
jgi:hypothetical protein